MLYIRTDINDIIATGHVMRCLSIADAVRENEEDVTFILADENGKNYIEKRGYRTIILHTEWDDMESEIPVLCDVIKEKKITSILIDSYQITEYYLKVLSNYVKTIYIDDFAKRKYSVSALICYMSHWEKLQHKEMYLNTKLMLGLQYAPVRKAFQNIEKKEIKKDVETVLLLSGGTDPYNILSKMLRIIKEMNFKEIIVICGRYNSEFDVLLEEYKDDNRICILKSVDNIEEYMKKTDLAISAGGTTLYELCACGTPTISYAFADNQLENVYGFAGKKIIEYAGDVRYEDIFDNMKYIIKKYCESIELRKMYSQKMQLLVDGKGASHIVSEWKKLLKE